MQYSPIWLNTHPNQQHNSFIRPWYNKGVINIIYLLNKNGHFYDFDELMENINIHGTFLDYHSVIRTKQNRT